MKNKENYLTFIQSNELVDQKKMIYKNDEPILISEKYSADCTSDSPQNAGAFQAIIDYSRNSYAHSKHVNSKEAILDLIDRNENILQKMMIFKVLEVDCNIHPAKKLQLNQKGRASSWEWIDVKNKAELINIFNSNFLQLKQ